MYLYVLKQAQNKYYIGKSRYIKSRIQKHFMGYGTDGPKNINQNLYIL